MTLYLAKSVYYSCEQDLQSDELKKNLTNIRDVVFVDVASRYWTCPEMIKDLKTEGRDPTYSQWSLILNGYPQKVSIMETSIQLIWKLYPLFGNRFYLIWISIQRKFPNQLETVSKQNGNCFHFGNMYL